MQRDAGSVEEVTPGDKVFFEAGEKHCHGAAATTDMRHIAVTEMVDGRNVDWLEPVGDAQYGREGWPL